MGQHGNNNQINQSDFRVRGFKNIINPSFIFFRAWIWIGTIHQHKKL